MKKIYNNLNIENLIKTEWFNQFDEKQQKQIRYGLEDNLDVFQYANSEFSWEQMEQIKWGLEDNLDVSIYTDPNLSWQKMEELRFELLEKDTL